MVVGKPVPSRSRDIPQPDKRLEKICDSGLSQMVRDRPTTEGCV